MMIHLLSNALSIVACGAAAAGCFVLHRRVRRLESTRGGIGKAVAEMSQSVARLQQALAAAETAAKDASARLDRRLAEARDVAGSFEAGRGAGDGPPPPARPRRGKDASRHDPLADIVPKGLGDDRSPREPGSPVEQKGASLTGREALARFAIAARTADRRESRRGREAAA